jgi:tRNA threonylcarbamoyl adenosine modification protein (Sua5/YciO/YrdC/YwlC family)
MTQLLRIFSDNVNERHIDQAVDALRAGQIILYPTDTVYALACDALNQRAIERLCRLKGINPDKQELSVVCADISQAADYARIDNNAFRTLKEYLPGPFTFILPASTKLPKVFKGRKTVGIRVPDNAIARAIAEALGNPVLTSSASVDDDDDLPYVEPIAMHYGDAIALAIDGGEGGTIPSTVVDLTDSATPVVIRRGRGDFAD